MIRPIAISLSPNTENKDILASLKMLFSPWNFFKGNYTRLLEQWFRQYFGVSYAISFVSGRGALFATLKTLGIGINDEVILQAFTCVSVADAIIATGAKPIFVDINKSLTIDPFDLDQKITKKTKAVVIQHTFGIPADLNQILKIAKRHKLKVIEDCAHAIGLEYKNKKLGAFGDAAFFSFGRDKAFSSVFGGMVITNNKPLGKSLRLFQRQQGYPSFFWVWQQLFHPIAFYFILPFYNFFSVGKIILVFFQTLNLLSFPISWEEKHGQLPKKFIKRLPNALSFLALYQLKKIKEYNGKREEISNLYLTKLNQTRFVFPYKKSLAFLRFPILVNDRDKMLSFFKKRGIYLGKWYSEVIDPKGVDLKKVFYQKGSCPNAEFIAQRIINLPTYPTIQISQIEKIIRLLKKYNEN